MSHKGLFVSSDSEVKKGKDQRTSKKSKNKGQTSKKVLALFYALNWCERVLESL